MRTLGAVIAVLLTSCTFPTVTYEESCELPNNCPGQKFVNDGNDARSDLDTCRMECSGNPECSKCESDYTAAIDSIRIDCEQCAALNGCAEATESCLNLIEP